MRKFRLLLVIAIAMTSFNSMALKPYGTSEMYFEYNGFVMSLYSLYNNELLFPLGERATGNAELVNSKGANYYSYVFNDFKQATYYELRNETDELEKVTAEYKTYVNRLGKTISRPVKLFEYEKGSIKKQTLFKYNEIGILLEKKMISGNGTISIQQTILDDNGSISYTLTLKGGKVTRRSIYEYFDGTKKLKSISRYNKKGHLYSKQVFTCDKTGEEITKKSKLSESCTYKEESREYYTWITEGENRFGKYKMVNKFRVIDSIQVSALTIRDSGDTSYFETYDPETEAFQRVNFYKGKRTFVSKSWKEENKRINERYYKGKLTTRKVKTLNESGKVIKLEVFENENEIISTLQYTYDQDRLKQVIKQGKKSKSDFTVNFF